MFSTQELGDVPADLTGFVQGLADEAAIMVANGLSGISIWMFGSSASDSTTDPKEITLRAAYFLVPEMVAGALAEEGDEKQLSEYVGIVKESKLDRLTLLTAAVKGLYDVENDESVEPGTLEARREDAFAVLSMLIQANTSDSFFSLPEDEANTEMAAFDLFVKAVDEHKLFNVFPKFKDLCMDWLKHLPVIHEEGFNELLRVMKTQNAVEIWPALAYAYQKHCVKNNISSPINSSIEWAKNVRFSSGYGHQKQEWPDVFVQRKQEGTRDQATLLLRDHLRERNIHDEYSVPDNTVLSVLSMKNR